MLTRIAALAALLLSAVAYAQTTGTSPNTQQVQLLAPQLLAFSGSTGNFDSLVTGLTLGTPVTLATVSPDGFVQIVTFLPGTTLSAVDAARNLETARQSLITRGIAAPTAQQLAVALMGGTLTTPSGSTAVTGVLTGTTGTMTAIQVRNELAAFSAVGSGITTLNLSGTNLQALRTALAQGSSVTLTSVTPAGATQVATFTPTGIPMNAFEVNQALQLASVLLAQQGILNPTPDQIRVALVGGNLTTVNGGVVAVQGVLQGRVRATSDSAAGNTSNSTLFGTSNTPANLAPVATPPAPVTIPDGSAPRPSTAEGANRPATTTRPRG
jgi:hypothetical protein